MSRAPWSFVMFPRGFLYPILGGVLIGASIGWIYFRSGRIAGISSILTAVQSRWSRFAYFRRGWVLDDLRWKGRLVAGLVVGALLLTLVRREVYVSTIPIWRLAVGGLFVGFGTRLGRGCTSGHGICGVSAGSVPSIVATLTFMGVAMLVAWGLA